MSCHEKSLSCCSLTWSAGGWKLGSVTTSGQGAAELPRFRLPSVCGHGTPNLKASKPTHHQAPVCKEISVVLEWLLAWLSLPFTLPKSGQQLLCFARMALVSEPRDWFGLCDFRPIVKKDLTQGLLDRPATSMLARFFRTDMKPGGYISQVALQGYGLGE